jgi:hypothetical protein
LGTWVSNEPYISELRVGSDGFCTLLFAWPAQEPSRATWSCSTEEDGSLHIPERALVAVLRGDFLAVEAAGAYTWGLLHRERAEGNLLAYDPAATTTLPAIEPSTVLTITVEDAWLSTAMTGVILRLQPGEEYYTGTGEFYDYHSEGIPTIVDPVRVPVPVIEGLLALLNNTPLEAVAYKPLYAVTAYFRGTALIVEHEAGQISFVTQSQGSRHVPWRVLVGEDEYVTYADTAMQAVEMLDPYLQGDVRRELIDQAEVEIVPPE